MNTDTLIIIVGLAFNAAGTLFGFWKLTLRYENRLTRIETLIESMPKRIGDHV